MASLSLASGLGQTRAQAAAASGGDRPLPLSPVITRDSNSSQEPVSRPPAR